MENRKTNQQAKTVNKQTILVTTLKFNLMKATQIIYLVRILILQFIESVAGKNWWKEHERLINLIIQLLIVLYILWNKKVNNELPLFDIMKFIESIQLVT